MSVQKINLAQTYTSDWELELEAGSNKVLGKLSYEDDYEDWMTRAPNIGSAHPDISALLLRKIKAERLQGDIVKVKLEFENNDPTATYPGRDPGAIKRYSLETSLTEEPLLRHDAFKDLTETEMVALQELLSSSKLTEDFTKAARTVTSAAGLKAIEKIKKGIEAFLNPGMVWVERFSTKDLEEIDLGKIRTTTSTPPGPCPSSGSERNWLYMGGNANPSSDGEVWDIDKKWQLSEKGKWDSDLYPAAATE